MNIKNIIYIFMITVLLSGCAAKNPSRDSGMARYDYKAVGKLRIGPWAYLVSITDKSGKELFNEKNRSFLSMALSYDVPAGEHKVVFVCGFQRYSQTRDSSYWKDKYRVQAVKTVSGDYIGLTLQDKSYGEFVRGYNIYTGKSFILPTYNRACNASLYVRHAK